MLFAWGCFCRAGVNDDGLGQVVVQVRFSLVVPPYTGIYGITRLPSLGFYGVIRCYTKTMKKRTHARTHTHPHDTCGRYLKQDS